MATLVGLLLAVFLQKAGLFWQSADKIAEIKKDNFLYLRFEALAQECIDRGQNSALLGAIALLTLIVGLAELLLSMWFGVIAAGVFGGLVLFMTLGAQSVDENASPFVVAHEQLFAPLFWFSCLGGIGCLLYWTLRIVCDQIRKAALEEKQKGWLIAHGVMAWIPARVTGLIFSLIGNFIAGFYCWKQGLKYHANQSGEFLIECGQAALEVEHGDEPERMNHRALVVWLIVVVVIALLIEFS